MVMLCGAVLFGGGGTIEYAFAWLASTRCVITWSVALTFWNLNQVALLPINEKHVVNHKLEKRIA
jgi:hypothetical protein